MTMSTKTQIRELAQIGKLARYGAMSAVLLLSAGSATLLPTPARADPAGGPVCNAPAPGAEFLSDQRSWNRLDAETANTEPQGQADPSQDQASRPGVYPDM